MKETREEAAERPRVGPRGHEVGRFWICLKAETTGYTDRWKVGVSNEGVKDITSALGWGCHHLR